MTPLLPRVRTVKSNDDPTLHLRFTDGKQKRYDVKPLLSFGIFRELKDTSYFKSVRVSNGTVQWPHEQDICPDTLSLDSLPMKERVSSRRKSSHSIRSIK